MAAKKRPGKAQEIFIMLTAPFFVVMICIVILLFFSIKSFTGTSDAESSSIPGQYSIVDKIKDSINNNIGQEMAEHELVVVTQDTKEAKSKDMITRCLPASRNKDIRTEGICSQYVHPYQIINNMANIIDISNGKELCRCIINIRYQDECLSELARSTRKSDICSLIGAENRQDLCYMHFVDGQDYEVCSLINDDAVRQSCLSLEKIGSAGW